jgi:hypothetical protein
MARCPDCDGIEIFSIPEKGNGICSRCHGDGKKLSSKLNEAFFDVPLFCDNCNGSCKCPKCSGTGEIGDKKDAERPMKQRSSSRSIPKSLYSGYSYSNSSALSTTTKPSFFVFFIILGIAIVAFFPLMFVGFIPAGITLDFLNYVNGWGYNLSQIEDLAGKVLMLLWLGGISIVNLVVGFRVLALLPITITLYYYITQFH